MDKRKQIIRISRNAVMLALLCVIGMFSLPLGDNIKVSLQLLMVFIIGLTSVSVIDAVIVTGLYLAIGLLIPVVVLVIPLYFLNKLPIKNQFIRMAIACVVGLLVCYAIGTTFLALYLKLNIQKALLIAVVPYIPFDIAKIIIAVLVVSLLPKRSSSL